MLSQKVLPRGLSACETFRACPDCGGDVGAVEDAPSDASSDVDLPPLGPASESFDFVGALGVCCIMNKRNLLLGPKPWQASPASHIKTRDGGAAAGPAIGDLLADARLW